MKLQFKHQIFQEEAAKAVCDVFAGQPYAAPIYLIDQGVLTGTTKDIEETDIGFRNQEIQLMERQLLENLNKVQGEYRLKQDMALSSYGVMLEDPLTEKKTRHSMRNNLTIEMETGVGKTYTYIKTMYELKQRYGWSKFIVVVPSVAIREGVYKSFQITQDHFVEDYGEKIRFFIYNSKRLTDIEHFASDNAINVMIINAQAFNARGKDARRIYMKMDSFRSRRPIDIIAKTNPIVIIDEPQSVEGPKTKNSIGWFNPLMILRYSATHREDNKHNMVYRLDAIDAYNKQLVKKIAVKSIAVSGTTSTDGYLFLQQIMVSKKNPQAMLEFEVRGKTGVRKITRKVSERFNLYDHSNKMEQYKDGYVVQSINGTDNSISFLNGKKLFAGNVCGMVNEEHLRRIQIRETIASHLESERILFGKGIKVLSLFFIDEVAKYRQYDEAGKAVAGEYARIFEEEYDSIVKEHFAQGEFGNGDYFRYLENIEADATHQGYFSIDKNKKTGQERFINSRLERGSTESADSAAYDLIMKDKERLLDFDEPVRFIFSHSALREGWDNPNVFQICTLKQSSSDIRKRQEVGRGLRLSVNQYGERMDAALLGKDVHNINKLTVIANESYDEFTRALQREIAEAVADRPVAVTEALFIGQEVVDVSGNSRTIDAEMARVIYFSLIKQDYITTEGELTNQFHEAKKNEQVVFDEKLADYRDSLIQILDRVYDPKAIKIEDARTGNVEVSINSAQLERDEFKALWEQINAQSVYTVSFDSGELVKKAVAALDKELNVASVTIKVTRGEMVSIESKEQLHEGSAFNKIKENSEKATYVVASGAVKYDLVGKLTEETGLTRKMVVQILQGIRADKFVLFQKNPEEFIVKSANIINGQKATVIIEHIKYEKTEQSHEMTLFTEPRLKGRLGENVIAADKHVFDYVIYDSPNERNFAKSIDICDEVVVYAKLPSGFYISTPVGRYNPDWAIVFDSKKVRHIYFIAETKGSMDSLQLRLIEGAKIECARKHFAVVSSENVKYEVANSFEALMDIVRG